MSASAPRQVAYDVIRAVHESDAYANLLLPRTMERAGLTGADAALATELTYGTLRKQGTYDAIIAIAADRPIAEIDPAVRDALRLGVHQLLSTRVASHAAVHESVELVRNVGRGASGFTNAVLRRVSRDTPGDWMTRVEQSARSDDERLGVVFSHPVWIVRAFRRALAAEGRADELEALLTADNASPRVTMAAPCPTWRTSRRKPAEPPTRRSASASAAEIPSRSSANPTGCCGCRTKARSSPPSRSRALSRCAQASAGSTCAPVRAARRPCSLPRRWPGERCSRPTRSRPRAPDSFGVRSRGSRSMSTSPSRTAGCAPRSPRVCTTGSSSMRPAPGWARCAAGPKRAGASHPPMCRRSSSCRPSC